MVELYKIKEVLDIEVPLIKDKNERQYVSDMLNHLYYSILNKSKFVGKTVHFDKITNSFLIERYNSAEPITYTKEMYDEEVDKIIDHFIKNLEDVSDVETSGNKFIKQKLEDLCQ
jgi:hypothetical protein